jgi:hypothetical protein
MAQFFGVTPRLLYTHAVQSPLPLRAMVNYARCDDRVILEHLRVTTIQEGLSKDQIANIFPHGEFSDGGCIMVGYDNSVPHSARMQVDIDSWGIPIKMDESVALLEPFFREQHTAFISGFNSAIGQEMSQIVFDHRIHAFKFVII